MKYIIRTDSGENIKVTVSETVTVYRICGKKRGNKNENRNQR